MNRVTILVLLLVLFGGFGGIVYQALRAQEAAGKGMPEYSVYSEEDNGLGEAARLLRKLGWAPVAVTRPIQHTHHRGLLILVEPEGTSSLPGEDQEISPGEAQGLVSWVEQGNTLLLCGRHATAVHQELGVEVIGNGEEDVRNDQNSVALGVGGGYTEGIRKLIVEGRDVVRSGQGLPLWWQGDRPGAILLRRGRGWVLVVPDPVLTVRGLRRGDNVRFLYNVARMQARDGRVYFDEYHHGFQSGGGFWGYLHYYDEQWMLLQVLVVVGVAVWAAAIRLGPPIPRPQELHTDAVDYASAVARIYQRAGARKLLARALVRDFTTALARHLSLRRSALPAEILAAWKRQHPGGQAADGTAATARLRELLQGVAQLGKGPISERRLLTWTRAFDQFKAEVLRVR